MNVKKFLSDSYRRSIDKKISDVLVHRKVSQTTLPRVTALSMSAPLPDLPSFPGISIETATEMYLNKCQDLSLKPNKNAQKRFVEQFIQSIGNKSLHLSGLGLGPKCIVKLLTILMTNPQFMVLDLSLNKIGDEGSKVISFYLQQDTPLLALDLRSNCIGIEGMSNLFQSLIDNHHLYALDISTIDCIDRNRIGNQGSDALAELLEKTQTLSILNASMCGIPSESCEKLGDALAKNSSIIKLDLSGNRFGGEGVCKLFKSSNPFIEELYLSQNIIDDTSNASLCKALMGMGSLVTLDLSNNQFGNRFLTALTESFQEGTTIENLNISNNLFTFKSAPTLSTIIKHFTSIRRLNISGNAFGDEGCQVILDALIKNTNIIQIDLSNTNLSDKSASKLSECIATNQSLQSISACMNRIGDEGGIVIAKALQDNIVLVRLALKDNEMKDKSASAFIDALKVNKTLADIDLTYNDFSHTASMLLNKAINAHRRAYNAAFDNVALRHISKLKKEEEKLFQIRKDIDDQEDQARLIADERVKINEEFENTKKEKSKELEEAIQVYNETQKEHEELIERRQEVTKEFQRLKSEMDAEIKELQGKRQELNSLKGQLQYRLKRSETKIEEEKTESRRACAELVDKVEQLKDMCREALKDVLLAQSLQVGQESQESEELETKRSKKGKKRKKKEEESQPLKSPKSVLSTKSEMAPNPTKSMKSIGSIQSEVSAKTVV